MKNIDLNPTPHPVTPHAGVVRSLGTQLAAVLLTLVVAPPVPLQASAADSAGLRGDSPLRHHA
jgi:hypothetical protein